MNINLDFCQQPFQINDCQVYFPTEKEGGHHSNQLNSEHKKIEQPVSTNYSQNDVQMTGGNISPLEDVDQFSDLQVEVADLIDSPNQGPQIEQERNVEYEESNDQLIQKRQILPQILESQLEREVGITTHFRQQSDNNMEIFQNTKEKNDSKNVGKGMFKAFAHMILDKRTETKKFLESYAEQTGLDIENYLKFVTKIRKSPTISISEIRSMILNHEYANHTRTLCFYFLRKRFINHIFYSKMQKRHIHLKFLSRWKEIFKNPTEFRSLK